jgi:hypothetical protein
MDPKMYSVDPALDSLTAAGSAAEQFMLKGGVAAGTSLASQLFAGGNYLGAAAIGAGTLTLEGFNRLYGQHYARPYSERKGAKWGEKIYSQFTPFPTLSAERGINSLDVASPGERASTAIVSAFSRNTELQGQGYSQIAQENTALQNWYQDSGPFVIPRR